MAFIPIRQVVSHFSLILLIRRPCVRSNCVITAAYSRLHHIERDAFEKSSTFDAMRRQLNSHMNPFIPSARNHFLEVINAYSLL